MNPERPFGAVLTAMVTPMRDDGVIDYDAAGRLAKHLVSHGSEGLVISGTTGESPTTHAPEKSELLRVVRAAVGARAKIVAGAGSNDTAHAIRMAQQALEAGADGILSVVPYYSKPSPRGVVAHFRAIADATDLPVLIYDIPGRTGLHLAPETVDAIAAIPRVVGFKDATRDVPAAAASIARTGLAWYSGDDTLNLEFARAGAAGCISVATHVVGEKIARVFQAIADGDDAAAAAAHAEATPAIEAVTGAGIAAVYAKAAMQLLGVIPSRAVRLPHVPLDEAEYAALRDSLTAAGVL